LRSTSVLAFKGPSNLSSVSKEEGCEFCDDFLLRRKRILLSLLSVLPRNIALGRGKPRGFGKEGGGRWLDGEWETFPLCDSQCNGYWDWDGKDVREGGK
jgi:hypothetical protein